MKKQDFLDAGFKPLDDPQFKFTYDLSKEDEEYDSYELPAILWDNVLNKFCVTDGEVMFIYFYAENPKQAVEWASKITVFELN